MNQAVAVDEISAAKERIDLIRREVMAIYIGPNRVIDLMLTSLLAQGHVLLEGVPGVAKTTLVKAFAASLGASVRRIHDETSEAEGTAERTLLTGLGGGCLVPVGARGTVRAGRLALSGYVGAPGGTPWLRRSVEGDVSEAASLGRRLAEEMIAAGAKPILEDVRRVREVRADKVLP